MFGSAVAETLAGVDESGYMMLRTVHDDNDIDGR
jgi:hypothetical protein